MELLTGRSRRSLAACALATSVMLVVLGALASPGWAAPGPPHAPPPPPPRLPTQTVLTSSASAVTTGQSVTVTATLHPGVLVTAYGSVTFTDTTNHTALGTVKPATRCLFSFKPCVVTITIAASSLANGPNTIVGTYSGDIVEAPSSGQIVITANLGSPPTTTTCASADLGFCDTGTVTSPDGTTGADISTSNPSTGGSETISISFTTVPLPCSTNPLEGDVLVFSATNAGGYKLITYTVYGDAADALNADYPDGDHLCYESPTEFTTLAGTPAPESGGEFDGLLPVCVGEGEGTPATNEPCIDSTSFFNPGEIQDTYTDTFETDAADPRASN
jgi:hypothetical protein